MNSQSLFEHPQSVKAYKQIFAFVLRSYVLKNLFRIRKNDKALSLSEWQQEKILFFFKAFHFIQYIKSSQPNGDHLKLLAQHTSFQ